jgi:hypothetical protein
VLKESAKLPPKDGQAQRKNQELNLFEISLIP